MSSIMGSALKVSLFGESHGTAVGAVVDGLPAGYKISHKDLANFVKRRAPETSNLTTPRIEKDNFQILSGIYQDHTTGTPLTIVIQNTDIRSGDYCQFISTPRPSHADYTGQLRYHGFADPRGGGHFSGRLTAPLCVAGGIALQILKRKKIEVYAHIASLYKIVDTPIDQVSHDMQRAVSQKKLAFFDDKAMALAESAIKNVIAEGDSLGGVVEAIVHGMPAGIGNPIFDGIESKLAATIFSIPGVRGVEFGTGFAASRLKGSKHNDPLVITQGKTATTSNHAGGINGGIANGMPIVLRTAIKPTASISIPQITANLNKQTNTTLMIKGRHDPAIVVRAVPVVEAVTALVLLDLMMESQHEQNND